MMRPSLQGRLSSQSSGALAQLSAIPKFTCSSRVREPDRLVPGEPSWDRSQFAPQMITERDIAVWIVSALLAIGIGWSRYAKWRTRDKLVRELAAMDPERREKVLSRLNPRLAMEAREHLMKRFRIT